MNSIPFEGVGFGAAPRDKCPIGELLPLPTAAAPAAGPTAVGLPSGLATWLGCLPARAAAVGCECASGRARFVGLAAALAAAVAETATWAVPGRILLTTAALSGKAAVARVRGCKASRVETVTSTELGP